MNHQLQEQIQKHLNSLEALPAHCRPLLEDISALYDKYEKEQKTLARSVDMSTNEMLELYDRLEQETERLREAQVELNRILNNVDEVIFSMDMTKGQYVYISAACEKVYGYTREEFTAKPFLWKEVIHPEDTHLVDPQDERLFRNERIEVEYRIIHKDKSIRWIHSKAIPTLDERGKWVRTDVIVNDITKTRTAQQQLEETINERQKLLSNLNDTVYSVDLTTHRLIHISSACTKIYGYEPDDFYADVDLWNKVIHPDDLQVVQHQYETLDRGEHVVNQWRIFHKSGSIKWIENNVFPTMDNTGKLVRIDGITRDITERKLAEATIQESEERFRRIAENPELGIIWSKHDGQVLHVNDTLCNILGYTREEVKAKPYHSFAHPDDALRDQPFVDKVFTGELNNYSCEKRYFSKNKKLIWGSLNVSSIKEKDGTVKYAIAVIQDITPRKTAENQLKQLNATLEKRVKERTIRLEEANNDLEAFNFTVSHDLRTPLRAIDMYHTLIKRHTKGIADETLDEYLANIKECTREMDHMIQYLLDFARAGKKISQQELHTDKVDMKSLITMVFNNLTALEEGKDITLVMDELPEVHADAGLIKQVLVNLLSNAIKYSSKNEHIRIEVKGQVKGNYVEYSIKDNGVGFDMKQVKKLFKPFSRLHAYKDFKGTGAGLAIVNKIISFHNGRISAYAKPGQGATFTFTLPAKK